MPKHTKSLRGQPQPHAAANPDGTYECERILDLRIQRGERHYMVKWKGFDDSSDNTWEPMSNLENVLEDLIHYEETHQSTIKKFQQRWIKLYEERRVREPLKPFNISKMKRKLEKMRREAENANSESEFSAKEASKTKKIEKQKVGLQDSHSHMIKKSEHSSRKRTQTQNPSQQEKRLYKKRGRKSTKQRQQFLKTLALQAKMMENQNQPPLDHFSDFSKVSPIRQVYKPAENKEAIEQDEMENEDLELSPKKVSEFQTPKRNGSSIEEKRTTGHKQEKQEKQKEDEEDKEKQDNEGQKSQLQQERKDKFIDQIMENKPEEPQQRQQEIAKNSNAIASVLFKRMQPSRSNDSDSSQQPVPKKESVFKINNFSKLNTNCSSRLTSPKKYIYHPKKKLGRLQRSDSESQSCNGSVKRFLDNPILELEEEQKDSTPVSIKCFQKNEAEERREEGESNNQNEEMAQQRNGQEELIEEYEDGENKEEKEGDEEDPHKQNIENNEAISNQEADREQNSQIVAEQQQARQKESQGIHNQEKAHSEEEKIIAPQRQRNVDEWLSNYQKKPAHQIECIILNENNSNIEEENLPRKQSEHQEVADYKSRFTPFFSPNFISKSKKIKKQTRQNQTQPKRECRGIIGRSQQALLLDQQDNIYYRPSLNTLLQKMLSLSQLQLLKQVSLVKILSNFKMQNVIIFSVRVIIRKKMDVRYISYQALHQYFPKQLLSYLEEQGKIDL